MLIEENKLREMLARAELAESVTLPAAQFRDLCYQALATVRFAAEIGELTAQLHSRDVGGGCGG